MIVIIEFGADGEDSISPVTLSNFFLCRCRGELHFWHLHLFPQECVFSGEQPLYRLTKLPADLQQNFRPNFLFASPRCDQQLGTSCTSIYGHQQLPAPRRPGHSRPRLSGEHHDVRHFHRPHHDAHDHGHDCAARVSMLSTESTGRCRKCPVRKHTSETSSYCRHMIYYDSFRNNGSLHPANDVTRNCWSNGWPTGLFFCPPALPGP